MVGALFEENADMLPSRWKRPDARLATGRTNWKTVNRPTCNGIAG